MREHEYAPCTFLSEVPGLLEIKDFFGWLFVCVLLFAISLSMRVCFSLVGLVRPVGSLGVMHKHGGLCVHLHTRVYVCVYVLVYECACVWVGV